MIKAKKPNVPANTYPLEAVFCNDGYILIWDNRLRMSAVEESFFCDYISDKSSALLYFGSVNSQRIARSAPSVKFLHSLASNFLRTAANCVTDDELKNVIHEKIKSLLPTITSSGKISVESVNAIYNGLMDVVIKEARGKSISACTENIYAKNVAALTVSFSIEENSGNEEYPFLLLTTCRYKNKDVPLREVAGLLSADDPDSMLSVIAKSIKHAAKKSEFANIIYNTGRILDSYAMSKEEMHTFLKELELYSRCGISCRVPDRWKKHRSTLSLGMMLGKPVSQLGADAILNFDVSVCIDGEKLTQEEIERLIATSENLFLFRGRWVELKQSEMKSALEAYESLLSTHENGISLDEAMRAFLCPETLVDNKEDAFDITIDNSELSLHEIADDDSLFDVSAPSECFTAKLRPYQIEGVKWLNLMRRLGLGACLSDDMGLGKTIQAIAILEQLRHLTGGKSLIVIPASLLQNWNDEIRKFAPYLKFRILHASYGGMYISEDENVDVYITTYSMLARIEQLRNIVWDCVILDEAQAIKNPQTMQSKAAKKLHAKFRIAMTGTPIENSITDLWSIFDFLNPKIFRSEAVLSHMQDESENFSERLHRFVRPFILRRLKTDKSIISDLPEKIEMKSYCQLTQRQAILYKQITTALSDEINYAHGIERRGLVLSSILRLKQICNHPDQYTGHGAYLQNESGKMMRLCEICTEIKNRHERVLIFTQFKEMCEPLSVMLRDLFGTEGLVIHGSTSVSERGAIVERFNDPNEYIPFIVLSLRAGGVGLNLTAANHVIHFDRWWNPAVENQATDRAFRIGQANNVIVHKLICRGTLEEKIDKLIEHKFSIAMDIVENDVKLTELSDSELLSLLHMEE